jgi:hypothetical protein
MVVEVEVQVRVAVMIELEVVGEEAVSGMTILAFVAMP